MTTAKLGQCGALPPPLPAPVLGAPTVNSNSVTIPLGQCQQGATVTVTASNGQALQATCGVNNNVAFINLPNGSYTFTATQSANGQTSGQSNQVSATVNVTSSGPQTAQCSVNGTVVSWVTGGTGPAVALQVRYALDPANGPWNALYYGAFQSGSADAASLPPGTYAIRLDALDANNQVVLPNPMGSDCQVVVGAGGGGTPTIACAGVTNIGGGNATVNYAVAGSLPAGAFVHIQYTNSANVSSGPWDTVSDAGAVVGNNTGTMTGLPAGQSKTVQGYIINSANQIIAGPAVCEFVAA